MSQAANLEFKCRFIGARIDNTESYYKLVNLE